LVGGEHGLVVLLLVLRDHAEQKACFPLYWGPVEQVEHPAADLAGVSVCLAGRQQRQRRPLGARMLERVVQRIDLRMHRVPAADLAQQPQFFLVRHVRQVPDQR
jgi:hypothetical protein